jgi:hypothetical protein
MTHRFIPPTRATPIVDMGSSENAEIGANCGIGPKITRRATETGTLLWKTSWSHKSTVSNIARLVRHTCLGYGDITAKKKTGSQRMKKYSYLTDMLTSVQKFALY